MAVSGCSTPPPAPGVFTLAIAHINDHHSQLEPFADTELRLGGVPTQVSLGGFARQTAAFKAVEGTPNLLKIHAGDAQTGSLYYTLFKGEADAALMNTVCFDAFTPGNHEFDDGDSVLKGFLDHLAQGPCQTEVVSSNVVPAPGTPLAPAGRPPYLKPHLIKNVGGVKVGLIGLTIAGKTTNSSRPLDSTAFLNETAAAQAAIDRLTALGVRHIVAITHQGYAADMAMVKQLTGVDVVIGGDSHTLLGDFSAVGLAAQAGAYPTVVRDKAGHTVCIGQAWEYSKAFGQMAVAFDADGHVTHCGGQASLLIGEPFKQKDSTGQWQPLSVDARNTLVAQLAATQPEVAVRTPDAAAAALLQTYTARMAAERAKPIGTAPEALCLVRVPGERAHRSGGVAGCEAANTLARGSDIAQAVAEAFLAASKRADFALQNAGGVRVPLHAGQLTMDTAFTLLPYTNVLFELELTGAEVLQTLEDAVANYVDQALSDGSHPYAAGLRWDLDMRQPRGQRFGNVQVRDKRTGAWVALDPTRTYVATTNDFIATGKDGFATLGKAYQAGRYTNTYLLYTQTFVDHVLAQRTLRRPTRDNASHQKVTLSNGQVLP
ncbi:MAG: 5'-nucleotidase C-terminal domain-containing protein [Burkholderiales bacterium]|nr:5'-nucleotidase C-terminal domain-containing protein [Burkholderiales bacterium]